MKKLLLLTAITINLTAYSEVPVFLQNMSGCFKVSYKFLDGTEDFHKSDVTEWIALNEEKDVITLSHIATFGKHFKEEWTLNNGKYSQKVMSFLEDKIRYTCESVLHHNQLRCIAPNAVKPRRDRLRNDYAYLNRELIIQVSKDHWIQSEINEKMTKDGKLVTKEVGWIEYTRVEDKGCDLIKR